jgi:anti-sigma regulatory factor (Ser/Thr protein kinase)
VFSRSTRGDAKYVSPLAELDTTAGQPLAATAVRAVPGHVAQLRAAATSAATQAGADDEQRGRIALMVSEAASNAVLHAYRGAIIPGEVRLRIWLDDDGLLAVQIGDDGHGLHPRPESPGMGLGLFVITRVADQLEISSEGGTTITARFALSR